MGFLTNQRISTITFNLSISITCCPSFKTNHRYFTPIWRSWNLDRDMPLVAKAVHKCLIYFKQSLQFPLCVRNKLSTHCTKINPPGNWISFKSYFNFWENKVKDPLNPSQRQDHISWSLLQVNANKGWLSSCVEILKNTAVRSVTVK